MVRNIGEQTWFADDAKFFKDVYIYGTLYYDFEGLGDNLIVDDLTVNRNLSVGENSSLNKLTVSGNSLFNGNSQFTSSVTFDNNIYVEGPSVFDGPVTVNNQLDVDSIDVGVATVRELLELRNEDGTLYVSAYADGDYAGKIGIGNQFPEQELDIAGSVKIDEDIYDSANFKGGDSGYFLSRDASGIRWIFVPPDALSEGFFVQNEGVQVGPGSFTTMNFIGTKSGQDLVTGKVNPVDSQIVDVYIKDIWSKTGSGIHTSSNVGIKNSSPLFALDIDGTLNATGDVTFRNNLTVSLDLDVDGHTELDNLNVSGVSTFVGITTVQSTLFTNQLSVAGVSTISVNSSTNALRINQTGSGNALLVEDSANPDTTPFVVTANGRVGVGVSVPNDILHINGGNYTRPIIEGASEASIYLRQPPSDPTGYESVLYNSYGYVGVNAYLKSGGSSNYIFEYAVDNKELTFQSGGRDVIKVYGESLSGNGRAVVIGDDAKSGNSGLTKTGTLYQPLQVKDGAYIGGNLGIGSTNPTAKLAVVGDLDVAGHTELDDLNVSGFSTFKENSLFEKELVVGLGLTVGGATTIHNNFQVDGTSVFESSIELNSTLIDINGSVAAGKTDYRLASVGTGVSWRPPGVQTKNILYVTKDGNDNNTGLLEGDAKATIGGAAAVAQDGDTIYVRPGTYFENNPIGLRTDVSISGQDLRLVTVVPINPTQDLFHVRRGCLIENMNFAGNNVSVAHTGAGCVAFPPTGSATQNSGYIAAGPANEGPSGRYRSPYVRNCTNFMSDSIGMKIDGNHVNAAFTGTNNLGQDLKSMVCDSFTQYNQNGIGVSITNRAYAQLVSIFTINCDIAIFTASGGQCDLTNSNSSFGNFGLYADGTSGDEFTGITTGGTVAAEEDTYKLLNVIDVDNNFRKPFDGQGLFFKINLNDYPDTGSKSGIVTEPLRTIRSINITNGGSGYSAAAPPLVTVSQPFGPEGILAELSANISDTGSVSSIDIISSGRNFLPAGSGSNQQDIVITISSPSAGGTQATAEAITDPILYTVNTATEPTNVGLTTVTFNEFVPYPVNENVNVSLRRLSRIITSSHSFEYIGSGTDINSANPFQGGVPIPENEIVAINGGQVPFTSTDQKGNFRIGQGLTIDQTTSTISGRDFNRAIQANLTPLILALGG